MAAIDLNKYAHLIAPSIGANRLISEKYNTASIMDVILKENERAYLDVSAMAKKLPYTNVYELSKSIFDFLKSNIQYKEDGMLFQAIKSPSRLWKDKAGDCKSFAIFSAAILKALGIPYSIRFVSYSEEWPDIFTHVYTVAHSEGQTYIIDPVWSGPFNSQKPFINKKDYYMKPGLYSMGATATARSTNKIAKRRRGILQLPANLHNEAAFELAIVRQRLEIERNIMEKRGRTAKVSGIDRSLDVLDEFIGAVEAEDLQAIDSVISGIGGGKLGGKVKNFLNKAKEKVAKGVKTMAKIVTAPQRLLIRGILELTLPVVAPTFLYLFLPSDKVALVPASVQKKRKNQEKIANFIVEGIGMKRSNLMGILRNGITKKMEKSPEAVLAAQFKGILGIGWVAMVAALVPKVIELIKKIASMFGKNSKDVEDATNDMSPSETDFLNMDTTAKADLSSHLLRKDKEETAPGNTVEAFNDIQSSSSLIPDDGGKTGSKGLCG